MARMTMAQTQYCIETFPRHISIIIVGDHGLGKSQAVIQAAAKLEIPCIDFRLSQIEPADLIGIPSVHNGRTVYNVPEWWPMCEADQVKLKDVLKLTEKIGKGNYGDAGILFFDELNRATRDVQQAVFEVVHDHSMHGRKLPPGWMVVSAINGNSEIYTTTRMEPALLSRFFLIEFKPTFKEWFDWGKRDNNIHHIILDFLRKTPSLLDPTEQQLQEAVVKGIVKLQDRRSWHKFSQTIQKMENDFSNGKLLTINGNVATVNPLSKDETSLEEKGDEQMTNIKWLSMIADGFVGHIAAKAFRHYLITDYQVMDAAIIINNFSEDIARRFSELVKDNRTFDLCHYNEAVVAYLENLKGELSNEQSNNIFSYLKCIPREISCSFWQKWSRIDNERADKWYDSNPKHGEYLLSLYKNQARSMKLSSSQN